MGNLRQLFFPQMPLILLFDGMDALVKTRVLQQEISDDF